MKAIITAGGRGTRMRPMTFSTNKHLIPLANKPLLYYPIEEVVAAGIKDIAINYNPGQLEELQAALGDGSRWGAHLTFILQEQPKGLANIFQIARDFVGSDKFLMHLGDNIFYGGIKDLVDKFSKSDSQGMVPILHHPENRRMGVPFFDDQGNLVKYVEKPENPPHDFAVPGLYFFTPLIYQCFEGQDAIKPSPRGELEISSPYQWLIDHHHRVETYEFKGIWQDPGKFEDWIETNQFLIDRQVVDCRKSTLDATVKVEGRLQIGHNCQITNSLLRGPAIIGDNVVIRDSFIGPYSSINDNCTILNSRIQNSILGPQVKITNLPKAVDSSLIGESSMLFGDHQLSGSIELFVGNQCQLHL